MAETRRFFSRLVDGSATEVRWQISRRGQSDQRRWNDTFSWNDWRKQHDATSSVRRWTDQWQNHDASSLGWSTVWLVTCNSKSACEGRLIDGGKTMLFLGMIDGGNTRLLLPVAGGMIEGRDRVLLLSDGRRFSCLRATANQRARAVWSIVATQWFFLVWSTAATQRYF